MDIVNLFYVVRIKKMERTKMSMNDFLDVLRHDLHKISKAYSHKSALMSDLARRADRTASCFSRNNVQIPFKKDYLRYSFIKNRNHNNHREFNIEIKETLLESFNERDPIELHKKNIVF